MKTIQTLKSIGFFSSGEQTPDMELPRSASTVLSGTGLLGHDLIAPSSIVSVFSGVISAIIVGCNCPGSTLNSASVQKPARVPAAYQSFYLTSRITKKRRDRDPTIGEPVRYFSWLTSQHHTTDHRAQLTPTPNWNPSPAPQRKSRSVSRTRLVSFASIV